MKKWLLTLALLLVPTAAFAQCTGVAPANSLCGNLTPSPNVPGFYPAAGALTGGGTPTDLPYWATSVTLGDASGQVISGSYIFTVTDPTINLPTDPSAYNLNVTQDLSGVSVGFSADVQAVLDTFSYLHGDHSDAAKTTQSVIRTTSFGGGAGQKFNLILQNTCSGAGDCQSVSINNYPYGGQPANGDEGFCLYCGAVFEPTANTVFTTTGNATVGGGSTTTTQIINGSQTVQTITVASSTGFTLNEWVIVNASPSAPQNGEAVQLTAVGSGTISGVFRISQSSGVTVTPATVLPVSSTGNVGEGRYLVDTSQPTYTTGTVDFNVTNSNTWTGVGTNWTNSMVGGSSADAGCISAASQGTGNTASWFHISAVTSTTTLTSTQNSQLQIASGNYTISPCAYTYRVIPTGAYGNAGTLILETNAFTWSSGDNVAQAVGPLINGLLGHLEHWGEWPNDTSNGLQIDDEANYAMVSYLTLINYGAAAPIQAGVNQTAFIYADTSLNPGGASSGGIFELFKSQKTYQLGTATLAGGGSYVFDNYGMWQRGIVENIAASGGLHNGNGGPGGGLELDPVWDATGYHAIIGANVTDTLSEAGADLINLQIGGVSKLEVRKDGAQLTPVTFLSAVTLGSQFVSTYGTPTVNSGDCGTGTNGSVTGVNQSGKITIGSASTTSCKVTFSVALSPAPSACVMFPGNAAAAATGTTVAYVSSISVSQLVIGGSALANTVYEYHCY